MNLTQKIIGSHLVSGTMTPGSEIGLRIDQTLTQDATGTMAWLQFEALGIPRVKTDISLSYVDHNTLQMNFRNPDDHRFLRTVAAKFGGVYSGPGTGICHQLHLENFAKPGATLVGSDSHTPTAGGICSLAMGAGGLSVALAMAGEPYYIPMPKVVRVFLTGALTGWASAKDVILELLRRRTVKGGVLIDLGGEDTEEGALLLQAHTDTLGAMVAEVKANGRLRVTNLGGMRAENGETENVRVYTRAGKVYEGTLQLCNASVHVNGDYGKTDTAHFGGGAGAGVKVDPVAFLVVKDGLTRVMPVAIPAAATVDRVLDLVPEVLDRVQNFVDKKREEKDIY